MLCLSLKLTDNQYYLIENTTGTINMLGLAKRVKARILLASTSEIYGDPEVHPQPETYWGNVNTLGPRSCYDEGKRVAETMMYAYKNQNNVSIRIARIFNTFGPRMHPNDGRVVRYAEMMMLLLMMNVFGTRDVVRLQVHLLSFSMYTP